MTVLSAPSIRTPLVALAGNPNVGKTSLFNRLAGADLKVGNYPGVTVDRHEGRVRFESGREARLADVPGTYSLSARSREEQLAVQCVAGLAPFDAPDLVVLVVDASQLTRNLYLALQLLELDVPLVVALTMVDLVEHRGQHVDAPALARALRVPVVPVCGRTGEGLGALRAAIDAALAEPASVRPGAPHVLAHGALRADLDAIAAELPSAWVSPSPARRDALAAWALLSVDEEDELEELPLALRAKVEERRRLAEAAGRELEAELIGARYAWIDAHASGVVRARTTAEKTWSERADDVLLHPVFGFALFLLLMGVVFQSLFSWADPAIGLIERAFGAVAGWIASALPESFFRDFLTEGLIAGVGSVVVFLPQILLLFCFIGLMEDTGYMARVAFLMDRIMKKIGLHGRAFVPMMSSFACAVPAILATRTMERRRDRLLTMLVLPLMTCSARLPVYALVIAALFPASAVFGFVPVQGLLMVAMYVFSTIIALVAAAVLGRTLLKGPRVPLILELPPYRLPQLRSVLRMMWQRSSVFLREAGSVILVCTIGLWLLLSFPKSAAVAEDFDARRAAARATSTDEALEAQLAEIDTGERGAQLRQSYGGRLGHAIEPLIAPLGFDWKIGVGLIGAFAAREVFVSTMGVVYGLGGDVDQESVTLREHIRAETHADGRPVYTPLVGFALMVFFALACQCMSTLAAVRRETHTWRWPAFLFVYMTALAWVASFAVYQGGRLVGLG